MKEIKANQKNHTNHSLRLLRFFCPDHLLEEIEGDLVQRFERDVRKLGKRKANQRLLWNMLKFFRPGILLRHKFSNSLIQSYMFKNYLIIGWRNVVKRKMLSGINILGISFGITFALLALLFIQDELSFDSTQENKNLIYRVELFDLIDGKPNLDDKRIHFPLPLGPSLKTEIAGVDFATRYISRTQYLKTDKSQFHETVHYVDDFLKMFTLDFIQGNARTALQSPRDLVISEEKAIKIFGEVNVLGRNVSINDHEFQISGVFKSLPQNSSFDFQILSLFENFPNYQNSADNWDWWFGPVFIQLNPATDLSSLQQPLGEFVKKYFKPNDPNTLGLTNLRDIHFDNTVGWHNVSNIQYSYILGGIALLVLLIACINYVLISLSSSLSRTREVGIRKVMGATRRMIRTQFLGESLILILLSIPISLLLVQLVLPEFNLFMGRNLSLLNLSITYWFFFLFAGIVLVGVLAGGYPALILSNLNPEKILKVNSSGQHKTRFAGTLVVFQFTVCFVLLICMGVMYKQMYLIHTKDLGFSKENVIIIDTENDYAISGRVILNQFRNELSHDPTIGKISGLWTEFGNIPAIKRTTDSLGNVFELDMNYVDYDFFEILNVKLVEGRFFSRDFPKDTSNRFVINQSFAKHISDSGPYVGKEISYYPGSEVVGVVQDFNFQSLEHNVRPLAFQLNSHISRIFIKIQEGDMLASIEKLERVWKEAVGSSHLQFTFLDDFLNKQYSHYTHWTRIISISTFLAITIALLGLLGVLNLAVVNRIKEIGIRKVLGANLSNLLMLFSKQYVVRILIGFIIAVPLSYQAATLWLQNFAFKTDISWWVYGVAFFPILFIAVVVMSSQIFKSASVNPVESIRHE